MKKLTILLAVLATLPLKAADTAWVSGTYQNGLRHGFSLRMSSG
jgi:hypothetical protein